MAIAVSVKVQLIDASGKVEREGTYTYSTQGEAMRGYDAACDAAAEMEICLPLRSVPVIEED